MGHHRVTTVGVRFGAPEVSFRNIELDIGSFITDFAAPILEQIGDIIEPLEWLIGPTGLLNKRLPVISDLAGSTVTIRSLAEALDPKAKIGPFLDAVEEIYYLGFVALVELRNKSNRIFIRPYHRQSFDVPAPCVPGP